jgi:hypothetical protein
VIGKLYLAYDLTQPRNPNQAGKEPDNSSLDRIGAISKHLSEDANTAPFYQRFKKWQVLIETFNLVQ